ncbi:MAG: hypothetical protein LQ349_007270 [Xanthoria aureola]|nr:MAG: hypothetical protein LQ349_007270 [Xanthoria aureola]
MESAHNIIVSINFGTTYTAVAWVDASNSDHIEIISNWPTAGQVVGSQVPTEIAYGYNEPTKFSWGYNINPNLQKVKWFKLSLDLEQDVVEFPWGLTSADVIGDYLSAVCKHVIATLHRRVDKAIMQKAAVDFALTVPAIWSDAARKKTQDAAIKAGMGQNMLPQIYSEPECAAIYALKDLDDIESLRINDLDIITYKILQINPLSIVECTAGTGDYCESTFVDREFEKLFVRRMGSHYATLSSVHRQQVIKNFEAAKVAFRNEPEQEDFYVNLPTVGDIEEAGVYSGNLHLSRAEMRSLFDPIINRVLGLISVQLKTVSSVNLIVLVGGFGESEYLYQRVLTWASGAQIRVLQPREAATAIVRGAVLKGLETAGISKTQIVRRARRWYGVTVNETFVEGKHRPEDRCPNIDTGQILARNQIHTLVSCMADNPPTRLEAPVTRLCTISSDLTHLKKRAFNRRRWRLFERYYTARYTLCLGVHNNNLTFMLEFDGRQYGLANVELD